MPSESNIAEKLSSLAKLKANGVLSEDDFKAIKAKLLAGVGASADSKAGQDNNRFDDREWSSTPRPTEKSGAGLRGKHKFAASVGAVGIIAGIALFAALAHRTVYDCRSQGVQETMFSILRDNLTSAFEKSDSFALKDLAGISNIISGKGEVGQLAQLMQTLGKKGTQNDDQQTVSLKQFIYNMPAATRFSLNSLTEEDANSSKNVYSCRSSVKMSLVIPKEVGETMQQGLDQMRIVLMFSGVAVPPNLGIGPNGEVSGDVNVRFTVEPELSGSSEFLVRANWY